MSETPRSSTVCVDANLVVRLIIDPDDLVVWHLWSRWDQERRPIVAPSLIHYEVTNAFHRLGLAGAMDDAEVQDAIQAALALAIELVPGNDLHAPARALARRLNRPAAYDAHYLALAARLGAEFWTADRRLANAVRPALSWVHLAGEETASAT